MTGPSSAKPERAAALVPAMAYLYFLARYHSAGYAVGGALLLAFFYFLYLRWYRPGGPAESRQPDRPDPGAFALAAALALPVLGLWQYLHFVDVGDQDHSAYACMLWNLRHGNLHYSFRDMNMFGIHCQYTSVLWIPVQWLAGETGLKLGKGLCLIAAALLAVRDRRAPGEGDAAAWGVAALLLSPAVASQFFFGFHPEFIAAPVLVLALQAYRDQRLGRFLACTAFLAFSKEALTMAVGGMLLLALLERRPWKWILLPGLLCCLQMGFYWYVMLPRFAPQGNHLAYFMPSSPAQIAANWLRPAVLAYALHVCLPFLPLLFRFPRRYLILPIPLMAFYAAFPDTVFMVMWPNYAFPLAFLCGAGLILAPEIRIPPRVLMACAMTSLLCYPLWREIISIPRPDAARAADVARIRAAIPQAASVVVNAGFADRFAARKDISVWGWRSLPLAHFDYAVIDGRYRPGWLVRGGDLDRGLDSLADTTAWTREYARDSLFLFRRKVTDP
jgi:hypothetical protein